MDGNEYHGMFPDTFSDSCQPKREEQIWRQKLITQLRKIADESNLANDYRRTCREAADMLEKL